MISVRGFGTDVHTGGKQTQVMCDFYSMLDEQLKWQMVAAREDIDSDTHETVVLVFGLQSMLREMKDLGFFSSQAKNILHHSDLEPRNLLFVPKTTDIGASTWKLTAVLDWDDALAVPLVLTRRPPRWIWDSSDLCPRTSHQSIPLHINGDWDLLDPGRYAAESGRLTADEQALKLYFETTFVEKMSHYQPSYTIEQYQDEAHGTGRWLRLLFRVAIEGFAGFGKHDWAKQVLRDWREFKNRTAVGST